MSPAARQTKNKLAVALSPEQLGELFVRLAKEKSLTIPRIQDIALEEYNISIGLESANEFRLKEFNVWCERLNKRAQLVRALNANSDGNEASTIARQADAELQQMIFEAIMSADEIDVTSKEGRETADALSKIISRARAADDRYSKLAAEVEELKAKNAAAVKAVDDLTQPNAEKAGASLKARNALRAELGLQPLAA